MNEPLYVHTTGVSSLSDIHGRVAGAMSGQTGSAPDASSLAAAYGSISSAFMSAMGHALPSRDESFQATQTSSQTIGELLQKAAQMYEHGDQQNADELKAAAEALAGFDGVGLAGSPTGANAAGAPGRRARQEAEAPTRQARWPARSVSRSARSCRDWRSRCKGSHKGSRSFPSR